MYILKYNHYKNGKYQDRTIYCKNMQQVQYEIGKIDLKDWESIEITLENNED